ALRDDLNLVRAQLRHGPFGGDDVAAETCAFRSDERQARDIVVADRNRHRGHLDLVEASAARSADANGESAAASAAGTCDRHQRVVAGGDVRDREGAVGTYAPVATECEEHRARTPS